MSTTQLLRLAGSAASVLLCVHGVRYLVLGGDSYWRLIHNLADLMIFMGFGVAGLVAELFPRESFAYRVLKSNLPFLNTLLGRAAFYVLFGCFAMGNYSVKSASSGSGCKAPITRRSDDTGGAPNTAWGFFCVVSGIFMVGVGAATLAVGLKYRVIQGRPNTERLLAVQPSVQLHTTAATSATLPGVLLSSHMNEQDDEQDHGRIMMPFAPFPSTV
jgi:hypothetical protein